MFQKTRKIYLITLLAGFFSTAQEKAVDIEIPDKHVFVDYVFTENGNTYLVSSNQRAKEMTLQRFDAMVDQKFSKTFRSDYKGLAAFFGRGMNAAPVPYNMIATKDGGHLIGIQDDIIFDAQGLSRKYDRFSEIKGFETTIKLLTDQYDLYLGRQNKGDEGSYFYRTSLADQSRKLIKLNLPGFESQVSGNPTKVSASESNIWEDAGFDADQFYMVNKELNKDRTENQYNIAGIDYDGNVATKMSILLKLKNKYFALSNSGFGGYRTVDYGIVGGSAMDENATGNVYFDGKESYYIYGLYTKDKGGDMNKIKYHGFYINKYNSKGELLWTMEKAITGKGFNSVQRPLAVEARFVKIGAGQIGFRISNIMEKYAHFFIVDGSDGHLVKEATPQFNIDGNRYVNYKGGTFATGFEMKTFPKKHMDVNTMFASFLNPNVDAFLKTAAETDLNYNCRITENGLFFIEENFKGKKFRLLKFDWK